MNSKSILIFASAVLLCHLLSHANAQKRTNERRPQRFLSQGDWAGGGNRPRIRRMYAMCPPQFERIGNECYYLSKKKLNWLDAQFDCLDRKSKLAEPNRVDDRRLRKHLLGVNPDETTASLWLGGKYDWINHMWMWGYNGRRIKYQAFVGHHQQRHNNGLRKNINDTVPVRDRASRRKAKEDTDLQHHCTVMDRHIKYRWSAVPCMQEHYFLCEHRMPLVKKNSLQHIYEMWNSTFPNQFANEIEVIFTNKEGHPRQRFQVEDPVSASASRNSESQRQRPVSIHAASGRSNNSPRGNERIPPLPLTLRKRPVLVAGAVGQNQQQQERRNLRLEALKKKRLEREQRRRVQEQRRRKAEAATDLGRSTNAY